MRKEKYPIFMFGCFLHPLRSGNWHHLCFYNIINTCQNNWQIEATFWLKEGTYSGVDWFINLFPIISSSREDRIITVAKTSYLRVHIYYFYSSWILFPLYTRNCLVRTCWELYIHSQCLPPNYKIYSISK